MPLLSPSQHQRLRQRWQRWRHPARMGNLRRLTPLSKWFGEDRGHPIDRYYIERFLEQHRQDIHGRVLEVKDNHYTLFFGSNDVHSEVLDIEPTNPQATLIADLAAADSIPGNEFDCFVLTQTLQYIYDVPAALSHIHRILRPGGVLLATLPCISRMDKDGNAVDYWRFTESSCRALFGKTFGPDNARIQAHGNVLAAIAYLAGMAYEELSQRELDQHDPNFPIVFTVRAIKK